MNRKQLNNIKKYLDFLHKQMDIDYFENTPEQYDENIWFWADQDEQIFKVLHKTLEDYSVDIKALLMGQYVIDYCYILYDAVDKCLKNEMGIHKMYVKNDKTQSEIMKILNKINTEIPIEIYETTDGIIYVEGKRKYLDLISKHIKNSTYRDLGTCFVSYCYPDHTPVACDNWIEDPISDAWCINNCRSKILEIDTRDYVTADEYIQKCFE